MFGVNTATESQNRHHRTSTSQLTGPITNKNVKKKTLDIIQHTTYNELNFD